MYGLQTSLADLPTLPTDARTFRHAGRWRLTVCCKGTWRLWVGVPFELPRQPRVKVEPVGWAPSSMWQDKYHNHIWYCELDGDQRIGLDIGVTTHRMPPPRLSESISHAGMKTSHGCLSEEANYTKFDESPALSQARGLAESVVGDLSLPRVVKIKRLFYYLMVSFNWRLVGARREMQEVLTKLDGDCADLAMLFVILCQSIGIPSRPVFGLMTRFQDRLFQHIWPECFVPPFGWIPFDIGSAQEAALRPQSAYEVYGIEDPLFFFGGLDERCIIISVGHSHPKRKDAQVTSSLTVENWSEALRRNTDRTVIPLLAPYWIELAEGAQPSLVFSHWEVHEK